MTTIRELRRTGSVLRPAPLRGPAPLGSHRGVLMALNAALVAGALLAAWWHAASAQPQSLADVKLVGARGPVCVRLVVAQDVSGSMSAFAGARSKAVEQLVTWAPGNLRGDDQLVVLDFAATAGAAWGPTRIDALAGAARARTGAPDGRDTLLAPVVSAVAGLPPTSCDTLLVMVSDGQLADLPASADGGLAQLASAKVHDLRLLVPSGHIKIPAAWTRAFPAASPVVFDGNDAGATGLALARTLAAVTGQQVAHR